MIDRIDLSRGESCGIVGVSGSKLKPPVQVEALSREPLTPLKARTV